MKSIKFYISKCDEFGCLSSKSGIVIERQDLEFWQIEIDACRVTITQLSNCEEASKKLKKNVESLEQRIESQAKNIQFYRKESEQHKKQFEEAQQQIEKFENECLEFQKEKTKLQTENQKLQIVLDYVSGALVDDGKAVLNDLSKSPNCYGEEIRKISKRRNELKEKLAESQAMFTKSEIEYTGLKKELEELRTKRAHWQNVAHINELKINKLKKQIEEEKI